MMLCLTLGLTHSPATVRLVSLTVTCAQYLCAATALMKSFWDLSEHIATHCIKYEMLTCSFKRFNRSLSKYTGPVQLSKSNNGPLSINPTHCLNLSSSINVCVYKLITTGAFK